MCNKINVNDDINSTHYFSTVWGGAIRDKKLGLRPPS